LKKKIALISIIGISLITIIGLFGYLKFTSTKTAYVDIEVLYSNFKMKRELEGQMKNVVQTRKGLLDSMEIEIKALNTSPKISQELIAQKRAAYLSQYQVFKDNTERESGEFDKKIWTQLNQYVKDYGEQKAYDFILGTNGTGTIMHANDEFDITKDLIDYVNQRYEGKQGSF
jgi:outer membrane protein